MNQPDYVEFYKQQISLTDWLERMNHADAIAMRAEDNDKRERLRRLHELIGLPFDQPYQFPATVVANPTPDFSVFLRDHGNELCAIRLIPADPTLPKLRMRGHTIADAVKWFGEQTIEPAKYRVDFVPHSDNNSWSTIFVVNPVGIFGEILHGAHNKLTQGLYADGERPITFSYDFQTWSLNPTNPEAEAYLAGMITHIRVAQPELQGRIATELNATFSHDYLCGYFETTNSPDYGTWFIDYNRLLGTLYEHFTEPETTTSALVTGRVGNTGQVTGRVRVIQPADLATADIQPHDILVCRMTTPDYLLLMQKAAAIVTDLGGILSHAAIVARELGKPCLTGTGNATTILKDGQTVTVDADIGVVRV